MRANPVGTGLRLHEVIGRAGDALRVGSSVLMPLQIERALLQLEELSSTWCIDSPRPGEARLLVHAEARAAPLSTRRVRTLEGLLAGELGLDSVRMRLHPRGSLPRSLGKAQRVISPATSAP